MTMARIEVITSVQRRRRWSREEKERIVAASLEPGVVLSEVARREGIHSSQLFRWRRQLCRPVPALPDFAAVTVAPVEPVPDPAPARPEPTGLIEIELAAGTRVRISGAVDAATVTAAVKALAQAERRR
jgi:transposase